MINPFFKRKGPFKIDKLLDLSMVANKDNLKKYNVTDIKDLVNAKINEITFYHSKKYEYLALKTKASFCITTDKLSKILPNNCTKIIVDNVLTSTAMITKTFYPNSVTDDFDFSVQGQLTIFFKKFTKYLSYQNFHNLYLRGFFRRY